jgi:hypothetical protein
MVNHTLGLLLLAIFAGTELYDEADLSSAPVDVSGTAWFVGRLIVSHTAATTLNQSHRETPVGVAWCDTMFIV